MFDNILMQDSVIAALKRDLAQKTLPASLLFHGPEFSGKLSTALELARVVSCAEGTAEWNCSCKSCQMQRLLMHPYTLLLGSRYFEQEIAACADVLLRTRKDSARFLFIRAVRKLIRRFDPVLWEGEELRIGKAQSLLQSLEEYITPLLPGKNLSEQGLSGLIEKTVGACKKLSDLLPGTAIPVNQIRNVSFWAHIAAQESKKIVIIEHADAMLEGAKNALLKILEEPPEGVLFILLTGKKGGLLPTILSRLRPYQFSDRGEKGDRAVLEKIFREETGLYSRLGDYFAAWSGFDVQALKKIAGEFSHALLCSFDPPAEPGMEPFDAATEKMNRESLRFFLKEVLHILHIRIKEQAKSADPSVLKCFAEWSDLVHSADMQSELYNINAGLLVESLFYRMKEALK